QQPGCPFSKADADRTLTGRAGKGAPACAHNALTLFRCRRERRQARIGRFRRTDLVLTIRLSRIGKKKKPFYRVVVIERTRPRDGRVKEAVGTYDPLKKPAEIKLDAERIKYWMGRGAQPSDTVRSFLRLQKIALS